MAFSCGVKSFIAVDAVMQLSPTIPSVSSLTPRASISIHHFHHGPARFRTPSPRSVRCVMVRLRCDRCNSDAAVVSLVGYKETYLCEICEGKAVQPQAKNAAPYRQLANLLKPDVHSDPLVCGVCKVRRRVASTSNLHHGSKRADCCRYPRHVCFLQTMPRYRMCCRVSVLTTNRSIVGGVMNTQKKRETSRRGFSCSVRSGVMEAMVSDGTVQVFS